MREAMSLLPCVKRLLAASVATSPPLGSASCDAWNRVVVDSTQINNGDVSAQTGLRGSLDPQ